MTSTGTPIYFISFCMILHQHTHQMRRDLLCVAISSSFIVCPKTNLFTAGFLFSVCFIRQSVFPLFFCQLYTHKVRGVWQTEMLLLFFAFRTFCCLLRSLSLVHYLIFAWRSVWNWSDGQYIQPIAHLSRSV